MTADIAFETNHVFGTFGTQKKIHRFTNNLQGLQKVMVKVFTWNIISWNALLIEKNNKTISILNIENNGFILNTICHDMAKRAETRVGFFVIWQTCYNKKKTLNK